MNPTGSSRLSLPALLLFALCLQSVAADQPLRAPAPSKQSETSGEEVRVDMKEVDKILKYHRAPDYPAAARKARATGTGRFKIHFGPDGKVKNIEVLRSTGYIILDHACLWAFVHWQVRHPDEVPAVLVPITFSMRR